MPSAAEALAWLERDAPSVAILDYSLKDGPCTALARTLRERGVPFIIYSGTTNLGTVTKNQQSGGGAWNTLGTWSFAAGWNKVQVSRWAADGYVVIADAIRVR